MKILLTCPHAYCSASLSEKHLCDPIAEQMTNELYRQLRGHLEDVDKEIGGVPRPECDLNRSQCRNTPFRQRISNKMKNGNYNIILDIHSYPPDSEYGSYEITILDDRGIHPSLSSYSLYKFLASYGVTVGLLHGKQNDIIEEATSIGTDAFLIEFDEGKSTDENYYFIKLITEWITDRK